MTPLPMVLPGVPGGIRGCTLDDAFAQGALRDLKHLEAKVGSKYCNGRDVRPSCVGDTKMYSVVVVDIHHQLLL